MTALLKPEMTEEEYLAFEEESEVRHEFVEGEIFAMSGATESHNLITGNLFFQLRTALQGRLCRVYSADMKIRPKAADSFRYPDVSALCSEPEFADDKRTTLTNPSFLAEVLSISTEREDRGRKFREYIEIPSLKEYVLVSQDQMLIEVLRRDPDGGVWTHQFYRNTDDVIEFSSIGVSVTLSDLYENVVFVKED